MDWNRHWNLESIPDDLFRSEAAKRSNALRKTHSGGVVWGEHRPNYSRCRCAKCNIKRTARKAKPKPPAKHVGRPRKRAVVGTKIAEALDTSPQEIQATE